MIKITIDGDKYKKDGMCARVCPASIIIQSGKLAKPDVKGEEYCILCGQCVAICQHQAVFHSEFAPDKISAIHFERIPMADQLMELIKTRCSIRAFREKPLEKETIEKIIDGARFAPSGHNLIGIPPENRMYGALALGYQIPKFKNMIERKSPRIKWI